jgi:molecular chaperone DnaK (HSP70)
MYGIDRLDKEKDHIVLFYNMGDLDTEVSLVRYSAVSEASDKNYEHIEILAESSVQNYGGHDFDNVIVNMLVERFNALKER